MAEEKSQQQKGPAQPAPSTTDTVATRRDVPNGPHNPFEDFMAEKHPAVERGAERRPKSRRD